MTRFKVENRINAIDFGDVLEELGYIVNDETGEVYTPADHVQFFNAQRFLLMLTLDGHLIIDRDHIERCMTYFIPHYKCYNGMEQYCEEHADDPQCLLYDV